MRSCEYLKVEGDRKSKLLRVRNIRFYQHKREMHKLQETHNLHSATYVNITFQSQKNGEKDETITMHKNNKELCPVIAWSRIVNRILSYPESTPNLPVNTLLVGKTLTLLTSKEVISHIRSTVQIIGEDTLGIKPKDVGTHSIRSSFAMFLYIQFVRTDKIMLQGRWKSDAFLIYLRKQVSEFSRGLSDLMINLNNDYFSIPNLERENTRDIVRNPNDPRTRNLFSFASSLNNNGPGSHGAQTIRPNFHLWS